MSEVILDPLVGADNVSYPSNDQLKWPAAGFVDTKIGS